jgi:hypothetical protein
MAQTYFFTSMTRIAALDDRPFQTRPLPKERWTTGDYVVGEVCLPPGRSALVELTTGRLTEIFGGDLVVGAFGIRCATLEAVGDWRAIAEDGRMELLTEGGVIGKATSVSSWLENLPPLLYMGHAVRDERPLQMSMFVPPLPERPYRCPTILILGTSMSSGKTMIAKAIIRELVKSSLKVTGVKFTGAGQYHDILTMRDAGAESVFDFVDVGLPSSIAPPETFRVYMRQLLARIAAGNPDVVVAEIGASPFEPYNGEVVLEELKESVYCTVLCASDPYAVLGATRCFDLHPDLISGTVTDTTAGRELVEKLTGIPAISLSSEQSRQRLTDILRQRSLL